MSLQCSVSFILIEVVYGQYKVVAIAVAVIIVLCLLAVSSLAAGSVRRPFAVSAVDRELETSSVK